MVSWQPKLCSQRLVNVGGCDYSNGNPEETEETTVSAHKMGETKGRAHKVSEKKNCTNQGSQPDR